MKREISIWGWMVAAVLSIWIVVPAFGQDINKGYTFSPGEQNVTHTKLNNLVDQATINPSFYTSKSATTTPQPADTVLLYSAAASSFMKCSLDSLLYTGGTNIIMGVPEDVTPDTNAFLLEYSTDLGASRRISLNSIFTNAWLLPNRTEIASNAPPANLQFLTSSNGVFYRIGLSNVLAQWWAYELFSTNGLTANPLTNPPVASLHTHPTNADMLRIWDVVHQTNKFTTLSGLITNPPVVALAGLTNTDALLFLATATNNANQWGTNPVVSSTTLGAVAQYAAHTFVQGNIPLPTGNAVLGPYAHGLGGIPQQVRVVMVCTNSDQGYAVGDEVFFPIAEWAAQADATNILLPTAGAGAINIPNKATGNNGVSITKLNWNLKIYAERFSQ